MSDFKQPRYCPLQNGKEICPKGDCEWWYDGEEKCAVLVLAGELKNLSSIAEEINKG